MSFPAYQSYRDSGVGWLGHIPDQWELVPLKRVSPKQVVGIVVNPTDYVSKDESGLPYIYGGDILDKGVVAWKTSRRISIADSNRNSKTKLGSGDLVTVRVGAPGLTAVVPPECVGGNCASVMLIKSGDYCSDWLAYAMNSSVVRFQVEIVKYGAAQEQFNIAHAVEFKIPRPPEAEQKSIARFLDHETVKIDALIKAQEDLLALKREQIAALALAAYSDPAVVKVRLRHFVELVNRPVNLDLATT